MHRPLRLASAEPATVTVPAAYEGAVPKTSEQNRALTCNYKAPSALTVVAVSR
ncbi:hypothetical protein AB0G74_27715 [Streptomyces sp. NPDC020875]|uniref:hypothetical protein n=1 Tax=Streptomyces sp. NPDC020875 TaxID=3154898 RepID=UPI003401DEBE